MLNPVFENCIEYVRMLNLEEKAKQFSAKIFIPRTNTQLLPLKSKVKDITFNIHRVINTDIIIR